MVLQVPLTLWVPPRASICWVAAQELRSEWRVRRPCFGFSSDFLGALPRPEVEAWNVLGWKKLEVLVCKVCELEALTKIWYVIVE